MTFPKPLLGDVCAITITSPDLEASLQYYERLGFREVYRSEIPFPWIQVSDGALLIMLRFMKHPFIALTYYVKEFDATVAALEEKGIVFSEKKSIGEFVRRAVTQSPDDLTLSLVSFVEGFFQPAGPTMLTMQPQDYANPEKYANQVAGMFGEFSHPVTNLDTSIAYWEKLGYKTLSKNATPYPWSIMSDGLGILGLHQTNDFDYPAITFFAKDMKQRIDKLIANGLTNCAEFQGPAHLVVTTPESQHLFLFSL